MCHSLTVVSSSPTMSQSSPLFTGRSSTAAKWAALHHPMEYLAGNPSFNITHRRARDLLNCCLAMQTQARAAAPHFDRRQASSQCSTGGRSHGSRKYWGLLRSQQQLPSVTPHQHLDARFRAAYPCARGQPRAHPMRPRRHRRERDKHIDILKHFAPNLSRMAICGWSRSRLRPSEQIS